MKRERCVLLRILPLVLILLSCSGTFKHNLEFNPGEPIRVAILPFARVNEQGEVISADGGLLIDEVGVVSSKPSDDPNKFVRKIVNTELSKSSLDLIPPAVVDSHLVHNGYALKNGGEDFPIDVANLYKASPKELCSRVLQCDAVLYGKIHRWDRSYYGLQSNHAVRIELKMVSAKDNRAIFSAEAEDSEGRGITKGPTGFSSLVVEPIRGLDSDIIAELARDTVKKMLTPLVSPTRPEVVSSPPPAIMGAAHDALNGVISKGSPLTVVIFGVPKKTASFSIGSSIENIPMVEIDAGHYYGEFHPLPTDSLQDATVRVSLTDKFGRTTTQDVNTGSVTIVR